MKRKTQSSVSAVRLVERNVTPQGVTLVNPKAIAKKAPNDLVVLAMEIQKVCFDCSTQIYTCEASMCVYIVHFVM